MEYVTYFFERSDQALVILATLGLWLALSNLGSALGGFDHASQADAICGWAGVICLFTVAGVFSPLTFTTLAWIAGLLALAAGIVRWRRQGRIVSQDEARIVVVSAPLIILVSAMEASQWDEFSNWLPSVQFLIESDRFPDATQPRTGSSFPAYPYGWSFLSYFVARIMGQLNESTGPLLNVLLLLSFGLMVAHAVRQAIAGAETTAGAIKPLSWGYCALGALAAIPFNPTFAQKVALTSYADTSSAVALGFAAALGWMALNASASGDAALARRRAWQMGLALTVLVALKQAAFVLFLIVVGALAVTALRDPAIGWRRLARLLPGMIALPLVVYVTWRFHVTTQLGAGAEFIIQPLENWSIDLIPDILVRMATVLAKKGLYLALMIVAIGFGLRSLWRCRTPFDRLALIAGALFAGYNGFLFFSYVAAFGANDALRAASLWRYNMHLGAVAVIFAWFGIALIWVRYGFAQRIGTGVRYLPVMGLALVLLAPVAFAKKLRFDREPDKPYYRAVAKELSPLVPEGRSFGILDPFGSGESWVITLFQLGKRVVPSGYLAAFSDMRTPNIRKFLDNAELDAVLVHSVSAELNAVLGPQLIGGPALADDGSSFLLLRESDGRWRVTHTWSRTKN